MYRIVGADQREYGPIPVEVLRQWISEGRANGTTIARFEDGPWKPLSTFPEVAADLLQARPAAPTPPPFTGSSGTMLPAAVATHPLAIAGLVCGVLGIFCCCCGPLFSTAGAVSSAVALSRIKREPERWTGRNLALVGLILALVGYVIFGLGLIFNQGGGGIHLKPQIPWM